MPKPRARDYYVEVGWCDYDVDQEKDWHVFGPFRSLNTAKSLAQRFDEALERAEKVRLAFLGTAQISFDVNIRTLRKDHHVPVTLAAINSWLDSYEERIEEVME